MAVRRKGSAASELAFTAIVIVVVLAGVGAAFWARSRVSTAPVIGDVNAVVPPEQAAADRQKTREIAMTCTTDMATKFHIHPFLTIRIDGEDRKIPADVGIVKGCMHPLHTHDDTGKLHVESPERRDFTLGDFFAVWGEPFDKDRVLDKTVDAGHELRLLVNGGLSTAYENLVLRDGDKIMISYQPKAAK